MNELTRIIKKRVKQNSTYTQAPPVDGTCVRGLEENLGRQELGRATKGARAISVADALLAQAEVGHFQIALGVEQ